MARENGRWPRRIRVAALGVGFLSLGAIAWCESAVSHDARQHVVPKDRVELTFGRSEDYDYDPPEPGSYVLPTLGNAADGRMRAPDGRTRSLYEVMADRICVLAFIYTRCTDPDGCPRSLGLLDALNFVGTSDPAVGDALRLITVSFDPEYDTPGVIGAFAANYRKEASEGGHWVFLTAGSQAELKPVLKAYDQPIGRKSDAEDSLGPFVHQLRVYLIDRRQRIRNIYSLGFLDPRVVITDVRTLLLEEQKAR